MPPLSSSLLAELIGILLGDGGIYKDKWKKVHITVAFNKNETQYLRYVKSLFEKYFAHYKFHIRELKDEYLLRNISVKPAQHLLSHGLFAGNKTKNNTQLPPWVFEDKTNLRLCVRGLFDTDGCIYRKYHTYLQIQFKFASLSLITSLHIALQRLGYSPSTIQKEINSGHTHWKLYLCRQQEIDRVIQEISPQNQKHVLRYYTARKSFKSPPELETHTGV